MPKSFADRDQTKCSSQDGNFKPGTLCLKAVASKQASILEGNLLYKNLLTVGLHCKSMIYYLEHFIMLHWASHKLKRFASGTQ